MMAALCLVVMSLGSVIESLDLSLSVLAGVFVMIVSIEYADPCAWSVWIVAGLGSLLLPIKTPGILFLGFFGWYPICQKKFLRWKRWLATGIKFLLFDTLMIAYLWISAFITGTMEAKGIYLTLFVLANLFFYAYDLVLDRLAIWYLLKIRPRLKL